LKLSLFNWVWAIVLPLVGVAVLGTLFATLPYDNVVWLKSEQGPVEHLTAVVFLLIGGFGLYLFWRARHVAAWWARAFYLAMALGGFLMAGEETSYGQHIVGWNSPQWFEENSKQQETNLHNLYNDRPAKLLRRFAEIGFPAVLIIGPLVFLALGSYARKDWPYWLLPKGELILWLVIAALARPLTDMRDHGWSERYTREVSEVAELYWSIAIFLWVLVLLRRINERRREAMPGTPETDDATNAPT
jgi:cytochrome b561